MQHPYKYLDTFYIPLEYNCLVLGLYLGVDAKGKVHMAKNILFDSTGVIT